MLGETVPKNGGIAEIPGRKYFEYLIDKLGLVPLTYEHE